MKKCIKCQMDIEDDARFCSECGAVQEQPKQEKTGADARYCIQCGTSLSGEDEYCPECGKKQSETIGAAANMNAEQARENRTFQNPTADHLKKAAYVGCVLLLLAAFMPLVTIIGMMNITILDISKPISLLLFVVCIGAAYAAMRDKYEFLPVVSNGFILLFLAGLYKYQSAMNEAKKSFFGAMAGQAVSVGWGVYSFLVGSIVLGIAGLGCSLLMKGEPLAAEQYVSRWKNSILLPLQIGSARLPGIVWSIALAGIFIGVAMQANPLKSLGL